MNEKQMTSKQKAIEALREVSGIVSNPEHDSLIADIAHELSKPTIDDAIKIIEEMKNEEQNAHDKVDSYIENWEKSLHTAKVEMCNTIITALKGLEGE